MFLLYIQIYGIDRGSNLLGIDDIAPQTCNINTEYVRSC